MHPDVVDHRCPRCHRRSHGVGVGDVQVGGGISEHLDTVTSFGGQRHHSAAQLAVCTGHHDRIHGCQVWHAGFGWARQRPPASNLRTAGGERSSRLPRSAETREGRERCHEIQARPEVSALPRRGGALPGDPTVPTHVARTAPTIPTREPHVDTRVKKSVAPGDRANAAPANRPRDRAGRDTGMHALHSDNPIPSPQSRPRTPVAGGPRHTSRSPSCRSSFFS